MAVKRCTECRGKLEYEDGSPKPEGTLTCSVACRSKRARRLKREQKAKGGDKRPAHIAAISDKLNDGDALHEAAVEEFRPLVREAMTQNILQGIDDLIGMQPLALAALKRDMQSSDETIAQRAYTLWFKYTLGNPSVAPPSQEAAPAGLTVNFNVPRPGDVPAATTSIPAESEELRACGDCHVAKAEHEFVAGSERCQECFDGMTSMLVDRFGPEYKA